MKVVPPYPARHHNDIFPSGTRSPDNKRANLGWKNRSFIESRKTRPGKATFEIVFPLWASLSNFIAGSALAGGPINRAPIAISNRGAKGTICISMKGRQTRCKKKPLEIFPLNSFFSYLSGGWNKLWASTIFFSTFFNQCEFLGKSFWHGVRFQPSVKTP